MVHLENLSFAFGRHWALREITLDLEKGGFLFLNGPSGAGKTTLLRILHGTLPVTEGRATVAGFDLARLPRRRVPDLRREVGVVFQDFKILPDRSVFENVGLALEVRGVDREAMARRVGGMLAAVDLADKAEVPCGMLSGGEQQRVAIARCMVANPKLILADEPTGNLDQELALKLMEVFKRLHTVGATIIMATHNREVMAQVPEARVLKLRAGRVVEEEGA
jgi:cell division transport system ATP-binding protein